MKTGRRTWNCELSTIDSTFLIAGALTAAENFNRDTEGEREIRTLADAIYTRADWNWARNGKVTVTHGWKPKSGFIKYRWQGYNEVDRSLGCGKKPRCEICGFSKFSRSLRRSL